MDTLRAPGGCPWDAAQDHRSLVQYLLEESYEVAEAIEDGDDEALREELGDLLLQVVFHCAIATSAGAFTLDDVAGDVADKLIRRHPHVFTPADSSLCEAMTAEESYARWDRIKAKEKSRTSVLDGIPRAQPGLARLQKIIGRATRGGLDLDVVTGPLLPYDSGDHDEAETHRGIGSRLLEIVLEADGLGVDAETAMRATMRALEDSIRAQESDPTKG
jgi:XTP/dITP diphosphohydrolase